MGSIFIQLVLQQSVNQQGCVTYHKVRDNPSPVPVVDRPCIEIRFQYPETVFYFIPPRIDRQNVLRPVLQIGGHRVVAVILLFLFNNCPVNGIMVRGFFPILSYGRPFDEPGYIMGALFHVLYVVIVQDLLGPFYLSVSDVTLVFHHFSGKGNDDSLF